jgi:hypothetical protein
MKTGAGIFSVTKEGTYQGEKAFYLKNSRGLAVSTALHKPTTDEKRCEMFYTNSEKNRMSNGCLNFLVEDLHDLSRRGFSKGSQVFVLPDDENNKFTVVDRKLIFKSNNIKVNRTPNAYEFKPITIKGPIGISDSQKIFIQTLADSKSAIMQIYPTVSNDDYNQIVRIAYGVFGQESSFGKYGILRGQIGRTTDYGQIFANWIGGDFNPSVGVTQIRMSNLRQNIRGAFDVNSAYDLTNIVKSSQAMMALLLDIYVNEIPNASKNTLFLSLPLLYSGQRDLVQLAFEGESFKNSYADKVIEYGSVLRIYLGVNRIENQTFYPPSTKLADS